jgi:hypothetical protein
MITAIAKELKRVPFGAVAVLPRASMNNCLFGVCGCVPQSFRSSFDQVVLCSPRSAAEPLTLHSMVTTQDHTSPGIGRSPPGLLRPLCGRESGATACRCRCSRKSSNSSNNTATMVPADQNDNVNSKAIPTPTHRRVKGRREDDTMHDLARAANYGKRMAHRENNKPQCALYRTESKKGKQGKRGKQKGQRQRPKRLKEKTWRKWAGSLRWGFCRWSSVGVSICHWSSFPVAEEVIVQKTHHHILTLPRR